MASPAVPSSQFLDFLASTLDRSQLRDDSDLVSALTGFAHAVAWRDPGVLALGALHAAVAALAVLLRRSPDASLLLFFCVCGAVLAASRFNDYLGAPAPPGHERWRAAGFSQNYFDSHGVFAASLFCAPLLLVALSQMLYALVLASTLLVKVKRRELASSRKAAAAASAATSPAAAADSGDPAAREAVAGAGAGTGTGAGAEVDAEGTEESAAGGGAVRKRRGSVVAR